VSGLLELDLSEVPVTSEEMPQIVEMMAEAFDEPVSDMIASPIAFAITRKSLGLVNTFFDGTGADDLFQGIPHSVRKLDVLMNNFPPMLQNGLLEGMGRALGGFREGGRASTLLSPILLSPVERELNSWRNMEEDRVRDLVIKHDASVYNESKSILRYMVKEIDSDMKGLKLDPANISVKTAVSFYFGPAHGFDCSRNRAISNKFGFSIISPFYDKELYKLGLSVPWYCKTPSGGLSKPLLRKLAIDKKLLPSGVALLKKMGLGSSKNSLLDTQMKVWATNELSGWISSAIEENLGLVGHLIDKDQAKQIPKNRTSQIFQILMFVLWYKRYFGNRVVAFGS
ncbi:MAG: asparagine synthase-related protein, partial [Thaumarchaeota archaeon]|nr:asparagine synthase-related protein [Nitrososphaerota archaeon]